MMGTCVSRTKNQRLAIMIDFNNTIVHWTRDSENVSLTIVSSQKILAHIFSCFSRKVSSQLQPASEEKNVEEPTDQDLSPGGIQNLWSSPEHGTAWVQSMFSTQVIIDLLFFFEYFILGCDSDLAQRQRVRSLIFCREFWPKSLNVVGQLIKPPIKKSENRKTAFLSA